MKRLFVPRLKCRAQTFDCYTIHTVLFDLDRTWVLGCCCSFHYLTALLRRYSHTHFLCSLRLFSFKLSVRFKLLFEHYKIAKQFHFEIYLNLKILSLILGHQLKFLYWFTFFVEFSSWKCIHLMYCCCYRPILCFRFLFYWKSISNNRR